MLMASFEGYRRALIARDVAAGLTVWAVLVPEALAYATIAGVAPVVGLYAAPAALVLYAVFGTSRYLVTGPMSATAALSAAAVASLAIGGGSQNAALTAALAITVGLAGVLAWLLRLGFLASFISEPVMKGFIVGLALSIIAGQLPKLFGVPGASGEFFEKLFHLVANIGSTNLPTLAVGVVSLAALLLLRRFLPRVPAALVVLAAGALCVGLFDLTAGGVAVVGDVQAGLPDFGLPSVGWSEYGELGASAVGILLVAFAEGLGAAKTYAAADGSRIDANRELLAVGAANVGAGLCSGMVVNGSLSKTAVNADAGARSQLSTLVTAALTVVTLLFLTPLFANVPEATLAAVVIAAVIDLVDLRSLGRFYGAFTRELGLIYGPAARPDFLAAIATLAGVLAFGTLPGLFIGVAASVALLVYRASRPHVAVLGRRPGQAHWVDCRRHADARTSPGILVVRPESGLFYANAENVRDAALERLDGIKVVVLDAEAVPEIDITAAHMLVGLNEELTRRGVALLVAREVGQVRDLLEHAGGRALADHVYPTVTAAGEAAQTIVDEAGD